MSRILMLVREDHRLLDHRQGLQPEPQSGQLGNDLPVLRRQRTVVPRSVSQFLDADARTTGLEVAEPDLCVTADGNDNSASRALIASATALCVASETSHLPVTIAAIAAPLMTSPRAAARPERSSNVVRQATNAANIPWPSSTAPGETRPGADSPLDAIQEFR